MVYNICWLLLAEERGRGKKRSREKMNKTLQNSTRVNVEDFWNLQYAKERSSWLDFFFGIENVYSKVAFEGNSHLHAGQ